MVNVYSDADEVELFQNGESLGRKSAGEAHDFHVSFETTYKSGILEAVNYRNGTEAERTMLKSAKEPTELHVEADRTMLKADGADLSYLMISLKDEAGVQNLQTVREVTVSVEGAGTLQGMGSADPATDNSYDNHTWKLYDGYVLAVVRAGVEPGEIRVSVRTDGCVTEEIKLIAE